MNKHILTQEGYDKLIKEKEALEKVKRPDAVDRLKKAREMGDLSENSGYTAAREELSFIDGRILEIDELLSTSEIMKHDQNKSTVQIGDRVILENQNETHEYTIVGELEADIAENKLSVQSPIGAAISGRRKGENLKVNTPGGEVIYKIVDIV